LSIDLNIQNLSSVIQSGALNLLAGMTFSGVIGAVVGYALKKVLKLFMVFMGLYLASLLGLAYFQIVTINFDKLLLALENCFKFAQGVSASFGSFLVALPISTAFIGGLSLGFMKG